MIIELISMIFSRVLFFALHVDGNKSFPKPLSQSKEKEYFKKMKDGDKKAREKLIEHNLRLVAHIIKKYYASTNDQEDLISIGTIGLIKAVSTFSYDKGTRFSTYASRCVENEILMHFRSVKKTSLEVFISDPIDGEGGGGITLMDIVSDDELVIDNIIAKIRCETLHKLIQDYLTSREKVIIIHRYGLNGQHPLTQLEVSKKLKISRSYVSRIEKKCLNILKEKFDILNKE